MEFSPHHQVEKAKHCAMEIKQIGKNNNRLLLEITLHTGRKHQIRSVLSFWQIPIIGDKKYGSEIVVKNKICLFAYKIIFANLSAPLSYLNGQIFQIKGLKNFTEYMEK